MASKAVAGAVVVALAGLVVLGAGSAAGPAPGRLALRASDLPPGFAVDASQTGVFSNAKVAAAEGKPQDLVNFKRWGRLTGYQAQFTRAPQQGRLGGVVQVTSRVSLYKTARGPVAAFAGTPQRCSTGSFHPVALGRRLGQHSIACAMDGVSGGTKLRAVAAYWRNGRVDAALIVIGLQGRVSVSDAAALAAAQDRHIAAALRR